MLNAYSPETYIFFIKIELYRFISDCKSQNPKPVSYAFLPPLDNILPFCFQILTNAQHSTQLVTLKHTAATPLETFRVLATQDTLVTARCVQVSPETNYAS